MRKSKTIEQQDKYYGFDFVEHLQDSLFYANFDSCRKLFKRAKERRM